MTISGAECRFPFEVDGVFYSTCTYLEESQDPVCAINSWGADSAKFAKCITTLKGFVILFFNFLTFNTKVDNIIIKTKSNI